MKYRSVGSLALVLSTLTLADVAVVTVFGVHHPAVKWATNVEFALTLGFVFLAARNLPALGTERPRFSPGASVGWFFAPLVNFYFIHQILTALWRESQPRPGVAQRTRRDFSVRAVNVLWLLCLGALAFLIVRSRSSAPAATLGWRWRASVLPSRFC